MAQITLNSTGVASNGALVLQSNGTTTAATIDTAQNIGLGVTPSAWGLVGSLKAIQLPSGFAISASGAGSGDGSVTWNGYYNGTNWIYNYTGGVATRYRQNESGHAWFTAPSGTAGNAITFTQAMTLDASGRLLLGTTTAPSGGSATQVISASNGGLQLHSTSQVGGALLSSAVASGGLGFYTYTGNVGSETYAERARIDSSGNLFIGATSTAFPTQGYKLNVQSGGSQTFIAIAKSGQTLGSGGMLLGIDATGGAIYVNENAPLDFYTNATQRARIDSNGVFKINRTTNSVQAATAPLQVLMTTSNNTTAFENSNATPYGVDMYYSGAAPNNTTSIFYGASDTGGQRFAVRSNGGIANYSANNVNLSDRREKTNFAPATSYLDKICAIPVQTFNYIDQNLEEDDGLTLGVVAQDVQAVAPEMVMESNWGTEEEPKIRLSIYQTDLQYALMKALQELNAKFEAYKASHP